MKRIEQKQQTRQKIVDAALSLGATKGFQQISIREITAICDLTPPAFYRHFHGLEELGLQLLNEIAGNLRHLQHEIWSEMSAGAKSIQDSLHLFFDFVLEHENHFRLFRDQRYGNSKVFKDAISKELRCFVATLAQDLKAQKIFNKRAELVAEIAVSLVFTRGLEIIDKSEQQRAPFKEKVISQVMYILKAE